MSKVTLGVFRHGMDPAPASGATVTVCRALVESSDPSAKVQYAPVRSLKRLEGSVTFDANGGTISGTDEIAVFVGEKLSASGVAFPSATGPAERPSLVGWYTAAVGGTRVKPETVYDGTYDRLYAHYSAQSFEVELNGEWYAMTEGSSVDPNGKSSPYQANPDATRYEGVYASYSNWNVNSGWARMRIRFVGYSEFVFYIRSYAESNYDYTVAGELDTAITSNPSGGKFSTSGNQQSGTAIGSYVKCSYPNDGGEHFVDVVYRKDGSVNTANDRGYVLIERNP